MKNIDKLLRLVMLIIIISCNKNDNAELPEPIVSKTDFDLLLEEYDLYNSNIKFDSYSKGLDTALIFFNGRDNGKIHISCFNRINKNKIFSWTNSIVQDTVLLIDEGYGDISTHEIKRIGLITPYKFDNKYAFILWGFSLNNQGPTSYRIVFSDLYFLNNSIVVKKESFALPTQSFFYYRILPWYKDNIIVSMQSDYDRGFKYFCYSLSGDVNFEFNMNQNFYPDKNFCIINNFEFIEFSEGVHGFFRRKNIVLHEELWKSEAPLQDLPSNIRIDNIEITKFNDDYLIFEFKYTLINGDSSSRKIKLNINSGSFELI